MLLKDFIKETLTQLVEAVAEMQIETERSGAIITPPKYSIDQNEHLGALPAGSRSGFIKDRGVPTNIEFEVILSDTKNEDKSRGIGVAFGAVNAGNNKKTGDKNTSCTKIKFSIPIIYPNPLRD